MPRRRKKGDGWFEILFELFTKFPAWLCIPVAVGVFILVNGVIVAFANSSRMFQGFVSYAPMLAGVAALLVLAAGLKAALEKLRRRDLYEKQKSLQPLIGDPPKLLAANVIQDHLLHHVEIITINRLRYRLGHGPLSGRWS